MRTRITTIIVAFGLVIGLLAVWGALDINWPWENLPDLNTRETTVTYEEPAQIIEIEAISLECHSRIRAAVPVEGREEHKSLGVTYRTDTVKMLAIGDVDTCIESDAVEIETGDGFTDVTIRAEDIQFVRPRVDATATQDSVEFEQGLVGKLTDVFPWVSDDTGLTPAAYSFAQTVIGGSDCMMPAFEVTEDLLVNAYRDQAIDLGIDPTSVRVQIIGEPDFTQNEPEVEIGDFDFTIGNGEATCEVADSASDGVEWPTLSDL